LASVEDPPIGDIETLGLLVSEEYPQERFGVAATGELLP
jgi:hypothetical protein